MAGPTTYDQAYHAPSRERWPGCLDGRCMPCGRLHDFSWDGHGDNGKRILIHRFQCFQNYQNGCPQPKPVAVHEYDERGRCVKCKVRRQKGTPMPERDLDLDALATALAEKLRLLVPYVHPEPVPYVRVLPRSLAVTNPFQVTWQRDDGRVDTVELDEADAGRFAEALCAGLGWRIVKGGA